MNSSATDQQISLSRLMNSRLVPLLTGAILFAILLTDTGAYLALKSLIPPERHGEARLIVFLANWGSGVAAAVLIVAHAYAASVINRYVVRPVERITSWAEKRVRIGEGPSLRTITRVIELRRLVASLRNLFDKQAVRVRQIRNLVGATRHNLHDHLTHIDCDAQEVVKRRMDGAEAAARARDEIRAITHILDINASSAKNFSHILGVPPTKIEVAELVHDCLDQLEPLAADAGLKLKSELPPDELVALAHPENLEDIIHNLVGNAIKYTPRGGSVSLAIRVRPGESDLPRPGTKASTPSQLEIEVADTGIGIPDTEKPHIFEHGYRGASALKLPGDGYGLNNVASVVSLYGGSTEVRDNSPQGTVVAIRLNVPMSLTNDLPKPEATLPPSDSSSSIPHPLPISRLYPKSDSGWVYAMLVTVPMTGVLAAQLFYIWRRSLGSLADVTAFASAYVAIYAVCAIAWKVRRLKILRKHQFAKSRMKIVWRSFFYNLLAILIWFVTTTTAR